MFINRQIDNFEKSQRIQKWILIANSDCQHDDTKLDKKKSENSSKKEKMWSRGRIDAQKNKTLSNLLDDSKKDMLKQTIIKFRLIIMSKLVS